MGLGTQGLTQPAGQTIDLHTQHGGAFKHMAAACIDTMSGADLPSAAASDPSSSASLLQPSAPAAACSPWLLWPAPCSALVQLQPEPVNLEYKTITTVSVQIAQHRFLNLAAALACSLLCSGIAGVRTYESAITHNDSQHLMCQTGESCNVKLVKSPNAVLEQTSTHTLQVTKR